MSKHSARGAAWQAQRLRILNRDGWTCTYCGTHLEGDNATVDHIQPISLDPTRNYTDDELTSSCRLCNGRKQDKPLIRLDWHNPRWFDATPPRPATGGTAPLPGRQGPR